MRDLCCFALEGCQVRKGQEFSDSPLRAFDIARFEFHSLQNQPTYVPSSDHVIVDKKSQPGNHADIATLTHLDFEGFLWGFGAPLDGLKVDFPTVLNVRR